jgi:putative ABC transport system permease protein
MTMVVRTSGEPAQAAGAIREQIRAIDRDLPVAQMEAIEDVLAASLGRPRFDASLLGAFGGVALLLALIGIYGVTSYAVGQRTREIGIRTALGASRRDVLRVILGRAVTVTLAGIAIGVAGSLAVTRLLEKLLFGIQPTDAWTFAGAAAALAVLSLVASYLPARHALAIDPLQALRME